MDIRPSDLIQLKKEVERIRKHEEKRGTCDEPEQKGEATRSEPQRSEQKQSSVPISVRLRQLVEDLFHEHSSSPESLEILPDYLVTVLQVIADEPKFRSWLLRLESVSQKQRNQQLQRMSRAFRIEDGNSTVAATFDRLHEDAVFSAVCQFLRENEASCV